MNILPILAPDCDSPLADAGRELHHAEGELGVVVAPLGPPVGDQGGHAAVVQVVVVACVRLTCKWVSVSLIFACRSMDDSWYSALH